MGSLGFVFPMIGIGKAHLHLHLLPLLLSACFLLSSAVENLPDPDKPIALFFFGDGVFDTGNWGRIENDTNYNHPPYGTTHFQIPTGRPSDGQLIADFMVQKDNLTSPPYRITPFNAQIKSMWRYGVSFATIKTYATSPDDNSPSNNTVPFSKQQEDFEQVYQYLQDTYGEDVTKKLLHKSIFVFSLGALDFARKPSNNYADLGKTLDGIFKAYTQAIQNIYGKGGKKFAFQNVEPFKYTPYFKDKNKWGCDVLYSPLLFKGLLQYQIDHWANCRNNDSSKMFEGAMFTQFDYYQFLVDAIEGPQDKSPYEIRDKACCGGVLENGDLKCGDVINKVEACKNPDKYLWFDEVHPTDAANRHFTDELWNNTKYATPHTLQDLFGKGNSSVVEPPPKGPEGPQGSPYPKNLQLNQENTPQMS